MEKIRKNSIFYGLLIIGFYLIPWLIKDTGSGMLILLLILPLINLTTSIGYGIKNGLDVWYPLMVALLFIPSIFIYYNFTAWVYVVFYGLIAFLGNFIALPFRKM